MSLEASDAEDWSGSVEDPVPSPSQHRSDSKAGNVDAELIRVHNKAPRQRTAPFFPEVHEELAKSWRAPYSTRLCLSSSSLLSIIDGAEEKGYETAPAKDNAGP